MSDAPLLATKPSAAAGFWHLPEGKDIPVNAALDRCRVLDHGAPEKHPRRMTERTDPRDIVFQFIGNLPATVKDSVTGFILVYAAGRMPQIGDATNVESCLRDYLFQTDPIKMMSSLLSIVAFTDHVLFCLASPDPAKQELLNRIAHAIPILQSVALAHPLQKRHLSQSLASWNALRTTELTRETLRDFADSLVAGHTTLQPHSP